VPSRRATTAALAAIALAILPSAARAGDMDPTPERLVVSPPNLPPGQTCQSIAADPNGAVAAGLRPQDFPCRPDNAAFANMVSELGFAIAPTAFYPARTTGIGGFQVTLEASYTKVNAGTLAPSGSPYWKLGTRGTQDAGTKSFSTINTTPDSLVQIYAIKARKGLPLGFELAGSLGYVANTSLWVGGGDVRWALLEGFREGALGLFPDLSVGGGVRTLTGTSKFYLTTVGFDIRASKPIALADSAQLIPSLGFQRLVIFADSNVLDATPNVDAAAQCGDQGPDPNTGEPRCRNTLSNGSANSSDFANNFTFQKVRVHRNRGMVALNYKYEAIWLGSQFAFDVNEPKDENPILVGSRQWTLSFEAGVSF
jgi:hypothetical protein